MSDNIVTLPSVKRGDTWGFVFMWSNSSTPLDLSSCSARMQIRNKRTKQLVAEVSTEDENIAIEGPEGKTTVEFPASITETIPPGTYLSDVQITFPLPQRVLSSQTIQIIVEEDITYG